MNGRCFSDLETPSPPPLLKQTSLGSFPCSMPWGLWQFCFLSVGVRGEDAEQDVPLPFFSDLMLPHLRPTFVPFFRARRVHGQSTQEILLRRLSVFLDTVFNLGLGPVISSPPTLFNLFPPTPFYRITSFVFGALPELLSVRGQDCPVPTGYKDVRVRS